MISFDCELQRGDFALDAAFTADRGITALFGPSGSGKSTILALIAGLLQPSRGKITLDDRILTDTATRVFVAKHKRRSGLVFQDAQLFPHMTVEQNLKFGRWFAPKSETQLALPAVADVLGLGPLLKRRPPGLSGGEKQRVALGRALLSNPQVLLLDEPLASLDAALRDEILPLIERMRDQFKIPTIYVTHAPEEVLRLASRVIKIEKGRVVWSGDPKDPASNITRGTGPSDRAPSPVS